jgi:DNA replication licensing factor MCM7
MHVHRVGRHPEIGFEAFPPMLIRQYISKALAFEPVVPKELQAFITGAYVQKRLEAHEAQKNRKNNFFYTQPRTLLSILRMSQALARIRFSNIISESDIREALRLMDASRTSLDVSDDYVRQTYVFY